MAASSVLRQQAAQLVDAGLDESLPFAGGVVFGVFLEVAQAARLGDALGQLDVKLFAELLDLLGQLFLLLFDTS